MHDPIPDHHVLVYQRFKEDRLCPLPPFEAHVLKDLTSHWIIEYYDVEGNISSKKVNKGVCSTDPLKKHTIKFPRSSVIKPRHV